MHEATQAGLWWGRVDEGPGAERWHQKVVALDLARPSPPGVALLGFCCDAGVVRNQGRPGAAGGPDAIRGALAGLPWHLERPCYDAGNLRCTGRDLEGLQEEQAGWVARLLGMGHLPLLLGGGHEIALGTFLGLSRHLDGTSGAGRIGVINFDAHFDLRSGGHSTSGTPFRQVAEAQAEAGREFRYLCLGVSHSANTEALFAAAHSLGAHWLLDEELSPWRLTEAQERISRFADGCDAIQLSIDLDVLPASVAPGVSAPAPRGVALEVVEHLLEVLKRVAGTKLMACEIAEMNPVHDQDGRTARVAARLCHVLTRVAPRSQVPT